MKRVCFALVTWFALLLAAPALAQGGPTHIQPRLIAESATPAPGKTVTIAIDMRTEKGWHGYWRYPGEAGVSPILKWKLPAGVTIGAPRFPVPHLLSVAGLANYVFESDHALLLPVTIPAGLTPGSALTISLDANWLACTDQVCVPESGKFALNLRVGDGTPDARAQFDGWRAKLPAPLGGTAQFERKGKELRLAIPWPASAPIADPHFFPDVQGLIVDAAPQRFSRSGDTLIAALALPEGSGTVPVSGLLATGGGRGVEITATAGSVPADGAPLAATATAPAASAGDAWTILLAIGGALLGGLILNVMPCVFPILSLKALSLAKAGGDETAARRDALGYTLGAVLVCVGLGVLLLALRAGGASIGWAFQLQNPAVIVALLVLVTGIALNLAGLFELPSVGGTLATSNSVATGALAAFVATPCAGPFLGAALGAALVLPPLAALAVFTGLGLGLALPFLLLGFVPALRRMLPKPGAWMVTLRRILSIPMFVTALGLAWLIGQEAGNNAAAIGMAAALAAALIFWWAGLRQQAGKAGLGLAALAVVAVTAGAMVVLPTTPSGASPQAAVQGGHDTEPFSEARLAVLRTGNAPIFVYVTADWCLTCKVNERVAIDQPSVIAAFKKAGVKTLIADWTRSDPAITRFLEANGRSGAPLYLWYRPGAAAPEVLPQVLTPGTLTALVG